MYIENKLSNTDVAVKSGIERKGQLSTNCKTFRTQGIGNYKPNINVNSMLFQGLKTRRTTVKHFTKHFQVNWATTPKLKQPVCLRTAWHCGSGILCRDRLSLHTPFKAMKSTVIVTVVSWNVSFSLQSSFSSAPTWHKSKAGNKLPPHCRRSHDLSQFHDKNYITWVCSIGSDAPFSITLTRLKSKLFCTGDGTECYVISQRFVGVFVHVKCSDSILHQLFCFQILALVHPNSMDSFEEHLKSMTLSDVYKENQLEQKLTMNILCMKNLSAEKCSTLSWRICSQMLDTGVESPSRKKPHALMCSALNWVCWTLSNWTCRTQILQRSYSYSPHFYFHNVGLFYKGWLIWSTYRKTAIKWALHILN